MKKNQKRNIFKALSLITQLGLNMIVPIVLCVLIGSWLDRKLGTGFFIFIFIILGIATAYKSLYDTTKSLLKGERGQDDEEDHKENK